MMKKIFTYLFIMLIVAVAGEMKFYPLGDALRINLGPAAFFFILLISRSSPPPSCRNVDWCFGRSISNYPRPQRRLSAGRPVDGTCAGFFLLLCICPAFSIVSSPSKTHQSSLCGHNGGTDGVQCQFDGTPCPFLLCRNVIAAGKIFRPVRHRAHPQLFCRWLFQHFCLPPLNPSGTIAEKAKR